MRFLKRFWRTLRGRWGRTPADHAALPWPPVPGEPLSRYLLSKREFHRTRRTVNTSAFVPGQDGRKSVFRTLGLAEPDVWKLGQEKVVKPPHRLHARADVSVQVVYDAAVGLEADRPPSRHAELINWPDGESARLLAATQLADSAELHLNPSIYGQSTDW